MTLLEERILDAERGIVAKVYEASVHNSSAGQRSKWAYYGTPFFDQEISDFWKFMSELEAGPERVNLDEGYSREERQRYIKRPIIVAVKQDEEGSHVIGGIWIDHVDCKQSGDSNVIERAATFHISMDGNFREAAHPLLGYFMERSKSRYNSIRSVWGARVPQYDPTQFFLNKDFEVLHGKTKNCATIKLRS